VQEVQTKEPALNNLKEKRARKGEIVKKVKIEGKGEKQTESREVKWRRDNTESRGWIKTKKAVNLWREKGGGIRCSVRERRWGMKPSLQCGTAGQWLGRLRGP
jgi:hypothetical protein